MEIKIVLDEKLLNDKDYDFFHYDSSYKLAECEYGAIQLEGESAYFPYKCNNCGLEGEEWYSMEFIGHNVYDESGELIEL